MKLLIIDDSPQIRSTLEKILSLIPEILTIYQASDVDEGIKLFNEYQPDIVILDLMLKTGTGIDVLKSIKDLKKRSLIILYSAFLSEEYINIAKELGADICFDKASEIFELVKIIQDKIKIR
jgi:NarL family two-component system response regulator LiaR